MKKLTAILLVLLLVLSVAFCYMIWTVDKEKSQVRYSEEILYGDKTVAEGLTIAMKNHYNHNLFWDTSCRLRDLPSTKTDFQFYAKEQRIQTPHDYWGILARMEFSVEAHKTFTSDGPCTGIDLAFQELDQVTAPGTEETREIELKDYYDYYPLNFNFDLPGTSWNISGLERPNEGSDEESVLRQFLEFFKIPVLEDNRIEITLKKTQDGMVSSKGYSCESDTCYTPVTVSTYTENECFFSFYDDSDRRVDNSLIPGGYGIYSFRYEPALEDTSEQRGLTGIHAETLKLFFPLSEDVNVVYLSLDAQQDNLLMITEEDEEKYLNVIRISDRVLLQKLKVWKYKNESYEICPYKDFWVLQSNNHLVLVKRQDDGTYSLYFDVDSQLQNYDIKWVGMKEICFDGEKLAIAGATYRGKYKNIATCDFYVAIYDQTGLLYCGKYPCSLAPNPIEQPYLVDCYPYEIQAEWE